MEILFYGPITSPVFILGKLGGALILYVFQICVLMMFLTFISIMSGILIDIRTLCLLGISVLPSLSMCAVGLGIAGLAGKQRLAVGLMGGLILLFILAEIGQQFAVSQPGDSVLGSAATVLASFTDWIGWMSPYRSFWRAGEALMMDSWRYFFLYLLSAIFYAGMMVTASIRILDIKGVQRWRE